MSSILERLVSQLRDQISISKNQLDKKGKVINTLLEKLEKKYHEEISPSPARPYDSPIVQTSSVIQATSVKTEDHNTNMIQEFN